MSEFIGEDLRTSYFETIDGVKNFHIIEWFDNVCAKDTVRPIELDAFGIFVKANTSLSQIKDTLGYLGKVNEMEPQRQKLALVNEAVALIASSPGNTVDEKVSILGSFSASMYNASRPINGKNLVMRHVNRYHRDALSADAFRSGFSEVYQQADELQWRTRTEIPRLKSRGQILREHFEIMTGEQAPRFIPAFLAVDAAMDAQIESDKAKERNAELVRIRHERDVQKIAKIIRNNPDALADAAAKVFYSTDI